MADTTGTSGAYHSTLESHSTLYASCLSSYSADEAPDCDGSDGKNLGSPSKPGQYNADGSLLSYGLGREGQSVAAGKKFEEDKKGSFLGNASKKVDEDKKGSFLGNASKKVDEDKKGSFLGNAPVPPDTPPPLGFSFLSGRVVAFDYSDLVGRTSTPKAVPAGGNIRFALLPHFNHPSR